MFPARKIATPRSPSAFLSQIHVTPPPKGGHRAKVERRRWRAADARGSNTTTACDAIGNTRSNPVDFQS
jgi:hypothetical protein